MSKPCPVQLIVFRKEALMTKSFFARLVAAAGSYAR